MEKKEKEAASEEEVPPPSISTKFILRKITIEKYKSLIEEIRQLMPLLTRREIADRIAKNYSISTRQGYNYINKVIKEDFSHFDTENLVAEMISKHQFRERQLLALVNKEGIKLADKINILKALKEEADSKINVLQQLKIISKPTEYMDINNYDEERKKLVLLIKEMKNENKNNKNL